MKIIRKGSKNSLTHHDEQKYDSTKMDEASVRCARQLRDKRSHVLYSVLVSIALAIIVSGCTSEKTIETITTTPSNITMDINEESLLTIALSPEDANTSKLEVSTDNGIEATIKDDKLIIKSTDNEGSYKVKLSGDKAENSVSVTVVDEAKKAAEEKAKQEAAKIAEQKTAEDKAKQEADAKAQAEADAIAQQQEQAQQQATYEQTQSPQTPIGNQVYIAGSGNGNRYHNNPNCSNMKNPIEIEVDTALARGYSACQKCY